MLNTKYFFAVCLLLNFTGCSNTSTDRVKSYCTNTALSSSGQPHWEGHPQYPHPSNDPAAAGAREASMGLDCYIGVEELEDVDP
jgi:hypothetical protein